MKAFTIYSWVMFVLYVTFFLFFGWENVFWYATCIMAVIEFVFFLINVWRYINKKQTTLFGADMEPEVEFHNLISFTCGIMYIVPMLNIPVLFLVILGSMMFCFIDFVFEKRYGV